MTRKARATIGCLAMSLLLAACGSAPKDRFYTLAPANAMAPAAATAMASAPARYGVAIGPVRVPEALDRTQMVVREGPNRVEILDQHRWAGSLRSEIARALAAGVGAQLAEAQVSVHDGQAGRNAAYRVAVDIERFDATLNESVAVQALWTIRQEGGKEVGSGRFAASEPTGPGGHDAIAAAYVRALSAMSAEVAQALRTAPVAAR
ncbi:PqiC family protein|uniref:PqiC family protein n=1 Tax=Noviherbaspirillum sp. L7-7A TaxID=2850560 RepID=UPI001C2C9CE7|nr:PqiC family protein [Noviherbaspirillum sp. L7-7A]MBV0879320.1 PqiC family protein [Noviherbaspirillum sp. L7-7A]